jgi:four helix bundle protein
MHLRAIRPFVEWEKTASAAMAGDPLWSVRAFRLALYAVECRSLDLVEVVRPPHADDGDQLTRAVGSIAANIAEGYSRASSADRARFYSYALGSVREAIVWYEMRRREIGSATADRQATLVEIRRLLLTTIRRMRPIGGTAKLRDPRS